MAVAIVHRVVDPILIDNIFQILISNGAPKPASGTARLTQNIDTFRRVYPKAQYRLYDNALARAFLQAHFGDRVVATYDAIVPLAFKADLLRYCLLYEFGGLYSDLAFRHLRPITAGPGKTMAVFRDQAGHPPWAINNGLILAAPRNRDLARVIRQIIRHAAQRYYGLSALDPTGPYLFGRVLAQSTAWDQIDFGTTRHTHNLFAPLRGRPISQRYKRLANGTLVAIKEKFHASTIAEYIGSSSNNYAHIWHRRQIWAEPTTEFCARDPLWKLGAGVDRVGTALVLASGHTGVRLHLPGIPLPGGTYRISAQLSQTGSGQCFFDVHGANQQRLVRFCPQGGRPRTFRGVFNIETRQTIDRIDISLHSNENFSGSLHSISIERQ